MQNSLGAVVAIGLGILLLALVVSGRFKAVWAAITTGGGAALAADPAHVPNASDPGYTPALPNNPILSTGGGFDGTGDPLALIVPPLRTALPSLSSTALAAWSNLGLPK